MAEKPELPNDIKLKVPYQHCILCQYFSVRHHIEQTRDGLECTCDLEPLCRNAVHIAWKGRPDGDGGR